MEITHEWENGPEYLRISGLDLTESKKELDILVPILRKPEATGSACTEDGKPIKNNGGIFFAEIFSPLYYEVSPTVKYVKDILVKISEMDFTLNSFFQVFQQMNDCDILFSAYKNGDYYDSHRDASTLTMLLWTESEDFSGGDLIFSDFGYRVPFEKNTGIVFPSHYKHEVTKIITQSDDYVRYCISVSMFHNQQIDQQMKKEVMEKSN